jgi:hypothetical protein
VPISLTWALLLELGHRHNDMFAPEWFLRHKPAWWRFFSVQIQLGNEGNNNNVHSTPQVIAALCVLFSSAVLTRAQDLPNSKDPAGMKRYEGSELIGYRAPMFWWVSVAARPTYEL